MTNSKKYLLAAATLVGIVVLAYVSFGVVISSNCNGFYSTNWDIGVYVEQINQSDSGEFVIDGEIAINGHQSAADVSNITLDVVGENATRLTRVAVPHPLGGEYTYWYDYSVSVGEVPKKVVFGSLDIDTSGDGSASYSIRATKIIDEDTWEDFVVRSGEYC